MARSEEDLTQGKEKGCFMQLEVTISEYMFGKYRLERRWSRGRRTSVSEQETGQSVKKA
jgi:hypothetical protein